LIKTGCHLPAPVADARTSLTVAAVWIMGAGVRFFNLEMAVFRAVTPSALVEVYRRFSVLSYLHRQGYQSKELNEKLQSH
jgi:hypothetical protein